MTIHLRARVAALGLGVALLGLRGSATGHAMIDVEGVVLVAQRVVDTARVEETYRATVRHRHPDAMWDAAFLHGRVWSRHPSIQVTEHDLDFGSLGAGTTGESRDTFTLRRHRYIPFRLSHLGWHLRWDPDVRLPATWTGEWDVTTRYFNRATDAVESEDRVFDLIRADDVFGLSALPRGVACKSGRTATGLDVRCLVLVPGPCTVLGRITFNVGVTAEALRGDGEWVAWSRGLCGDGPAETGQRIELQGLRLSPLAPDRPSLPTLLHRFLTLPLPLREIEAR